jgi:hypothetical protein
VIKRSPAGPVLCRPDHRLPIRSPGHQNIDFGQQGINLSAVFLVVLDPHTRCDPDYSENQIQVVGTE